MDKQLDHDAHRPGHMTYRLCFLAHDIDSPLNIGSFFRIADALGVEAVYLTGRSIAPPNSKIKKTSRSTEKFVPYHVEQEPETVISRLKQAGYRIISLEITSHSSDISQLKIQSNDKICLILGSENSGVSQRLLELSEQSVHIPMCGMNSSMNVANACAIASYEITKQLTTVCD